MLERLHFETREEWLSNRSKLVGIGGSEAAAVVGHSKFMTSSELWELKTGRAKPKNLSNVPVVIYGQQAEEPIRQLFMLKHPELQLEYYPFDIVYQTERPWGRATLDGELIDKDSGIRGVYEGKTHWCNRKAEWDEWKDRIPNGYYCQILHNLAATGYEFAWLCAELISHSGDSEIRQYFFARDDIEDDIQWLISEEEKFMDSVRNNKIPSAKLIF